MKIATEQVEGSQMVVNIEAEPELVERSLEKAYRRLVQRTIVPGFRKGKAPRAMLERYVGRATLMEDALEELVPELCNEAIRELKLDVIARPRVEVTQLEPVVVKATVPLRPEVELGAYQEIRISREPATVTPQEVDEVVERLRNQHAVWEPVERAVALGDLVTLELSGDIGGTPFTEQKDLPYLVQAGTTVPVPGFAEALVGTPKGMEREIRLTLSQDYHRQEVAGKEGTFRVVVKEIKEKRLPALDDDFAKAVGEGFPDIQTLRQHLQEDLQRRAEAEAQARLEEATVEAVLQGVKVELPSILIDREVEHLTAHLVEDARERLGWKNLNLEDYLRLTKKSEDELREEMRQAAEKRLKREFVFQKLKEVEGITVSEEEIQATAEETVARAKEEHQERVRKTLEREAARQAIEDTLVERKIVHWLVALATDQGPGLEQPQIASAAESQVSTSRPAESPSARGSGAIVKDKKRRERRGG